uniref:Uncharacterized protein n=1 Tax=Nelumbo nucifera TaxID=4432 RepID=A0A822Z5U4_NELNU|nr:TPA_asm: hypothetical protein HUJ06_014293 [Nelumbo nucifera]
MSLSSSCLWLVNWEVPIFTLQKVTGQDKILWKGSCGSAWKKHSDVLKSINYTLLGFFHVSCFCCGTAAHHQWHFVDGIFFY